MQPSCEAPELRAFDLDQHARVLFRREDLAQRLVQPVRRHGVVVHREKTAQQIARPRRRETAQCRHAERAVFHLPRSVGRAEFVEQRRGVREVTRRARERCAVSRITALDLRQDLVTQEVAEKIRLGIALVFDPLQLALLRIRFDFAARHIEQWP